MSTWEPLKPDGSPEIDSSKSLCDPHVFNTAITRAESLVVAVGNPISLLKTEKYMLRDPNYKEIGKCWSNFLKHCIKNETVHPSEFLKSTQEKEACLAKIEEIVGNHIGKPIKVNNSRIVSVVFICQKMHYDVTDDYFQSWLWRTHILIILFTCSVSLLTSILM
ncbi:MAG: hypothetical protein MJE68_32880 [Proteobacteria bacterium]|nr:hypothetical protein [Pseudomonadota bacterium]